METPNKKIIWNAVVSYFMVCICLFFLINNKPEFQNRFVRHHIFNATILHSVLLLVLYTMSFSFLTQKVFLSYSINDILTIALCLWIFSMILWSMLQAHKWRKVSLLSLFQHSSGQHLEFSHGEKFSEQQKKELIFAHIPAIWYLHAQQNLSLPHYRDICVLQTLVSLLCIAIFSFGYVSLSSFLFLLYIIYVVFQSVRLVFDGSITSIKSDKIPSIEDIHLYCQVLCAYTVHYFSKKQKFLYFQDIYQEKKSYEREQYQALQKTSATKSKNKMPLSQTSLINIISIVSIGIIVFILSSYNPWVILLLIIALFYHQGNTYIPGYRFPFFYDIYIFVCVIWKKIHSLTSCIHTLHTTKKQAKFTGKYSHAQRGKKQQVEQPSPDEEFEVKDIQK